MSSSYRVKGGTAVWVDTPCQINWPLSEHYLSLRMGERLETAVQSGDQYETSRVIF